MKIFLTNLYYKINFNNKLHCALLLGLTIIFGQCIIYFINDGFPVFSTNDSYGYYLTEAKNIYRQQSIHDISKLGLDLYFDQVEFANYDLSQFKPYHFPIYSSFLSLFFYIFDNEFFVIASSQFLLCLVMLYFCHLILINYIEPLKSLIILILFLWVSPMLIFLCDSTAEIFTGALIMISFYLGLFAKKRTGFFYYLWLFMACSVMCFRIKYLIIIPILCLSYRLFHKFSKNKFAEENENEIDLKNIAIFCIFVICLPLLICFYAYNHLEWHYLNTVIFDLPKLLNDPLKQIYSTTIFMFKLDTAYAYHNIFIFLTLLTGLIFFLTTIYKNFRLKKFPKILVIEIFYYLFFFAMILFYGQDGYRMLIGAIPLIFYLIYQNCNLNKFKKFFVLLIFLLGFFTINIIELIRFYQNKVSSQTQVLEQIMDEYSQDKIGIDVDFIDYIYRLPMMHIIKPNKRVMMFHFSDEICDRIAKYSANNFKFEVLVLKEKLTSQCQFINNNYKIVNRDDLILNKGLKIYLHNNYQKNNHK